MEADDDVTARACLKYEQLAWCDWIDGTKEQLQALGIGVGTPFPGEPGCPNKVTMKTKDPRGYDVEIERRAEHFAAKIRFPGWPMRTEPPWEPHNAPGVKWRKSIWRDEYAGTAAALIAAGLIRPDQLPAKYRVTFAGDGGSTGRSHSAGSLTVSRTSLGSSRHRVEITLPEDEGRRRLDAFHAVVAAVHMARAAMPRPERLTDYLHSRTSKDRAVTALAAMGVRPRRKLPPGWRVIEGQR